MELQGREMHRLLERGVTALEKLAEEPMINVEVGLPICPHCEQVNPKVYARDEEMEGPLLEFIMYFKCQHCHNFFYAVPMEWHMFKTRQEVEQEIELRRAASNGNSQ